MSDKPVIALYFSEDKDFRTARVEFNIPASFKEFVTAHPPGPGDTEEHCRLMLVYQLATQLFDQYGIDTLQLLIGASLPEDAIKDLEKIVEQRKRAAAEQN